MMNKNSKLELVILLIAVTLLAVGILAMRMSTIAETAEVPEVEMGIEIAPNDWEITLSSDETAYELEIYAPQYSGNNIEVYYSCNVIRPVKKIGLVDKDGFVTFLLPLDTGWVAVTESIPVEIETNRISRVETERMETGTVIVTVTNTKPLSESESTETKVVFAAYHKGRPVSYTIRLGSFFSSGFGEDEEREFSFRFPAKDRVISGVTTGVAE